MQNPQVSLQQENMVYYSLALLKPATQAVAHIALQEVVRNIKENGHWRYYEEVVRGGSPFQINDRRRIQSEEIDTELMESSVVGIIGKSNSMRAPFCFTI